MGLALAAGVSCTDPRLDEYVAHTGLITGTIFYPGGTERGNVLVLLFDKAHLPPPQGTSGPLNFIVVPGRTIFGDSPAGTPGDFAAPYTMPTVAPGTYQVRAFLDADGDFNPTQSLLAQPTAGDVGGGHIDLVTHEFLDVVVEKDKVTSQVTVTLGQVFPVERPAFAITSSTTFQVPFSGPRALTLHAHPMQRGPVKQDPAKTAFLIQFADADGDGKVDDVNGDHLPDLYPSVILRHVITADSPDTIIIPGIIDPFPYLDALTTRGSTLTTALEVILPPVAVKVAADGSRTILPEAPPGDYDTIVISGTGQTWQLPNALDQLVPDPSDMTQSAKIVMTAGPRPPGGAIKGTVRTASENQADTYVVVFDARNPPPPAGTGRPLTLASVPAAAFAASPGHAGMIEASYAITGLPDGSYIVLGFADIDGNFSPLVELVQQPSARDVAGGSTPPVVMVSGGVPTEDVLVELHTPVRFDRPSFEFDEVQISRRAFPAAIELRSHPLSVFGSTAETTKVPVALTAADADGDNFPDLLPKVLLTRMSDAGADPRVVPNDPASIVIPGIIDPISFMGLLSTGIPAVPASKLRVILPPVALRIAANGTRTTISPPPAGRYRVNLLSATGQTWSVPSDMDLELHRAGTALEDETQERVVNVVDTPIPGGAITGMVNLLTAVPAGDFQVIVFAFDKNSPPPPNGAGRPLAIAVLPKALFGGGATASYTLGGLATGTYQVRAYLDANDDFTPWYDTMQQPDAGDVGGGHINPQLGVLVDVDVDALAGAPASGIDVLIVPPLTFTTDRPMFTITPADAVLDPMGGPVLVTFDAVSESSDVLKQNGVFPIRWVDLDNNRMAEDKNGDGNPDVFPLVVAELLDPADETNLTVSPTHVRIPGIVDPRQFSEAGFPATSPTSTSTVVEVHSMVVAFPPIAVDATQHPIVPPEGKYRITLIDGSGQTWTIPNELQRAAGTALPMTQGRYLTVRH